MVLDRAGIWRHNRIAWIGCTTVPLPLAMLADQLAAEVAAAGFPVADPGRRFVPHLTLIRKVRDPAAPGPPFVPFHWSCDRFVLVRSRLGRHGSVYEPLAEFPLAGT
jgi:2'-5' RNA ligase